jgi:hypothetical protein
MGYGQSMTDNQRQLTVIQTWSRHLLLSEAILENKPAFGILKRCAVIKDLREKHSMLGMELDLLLAERGDGIRADCALPTSKVVKLLVACYDNNTDDSANSSSDPSRGTNSTGGSEGSDDGAA